MDVLHNQLSTLYEPPPPIYKYRGDDWQHYLGNGEDDSEVWSIPQIIVITLINTIKGGVEK